MWRSCGALGKESTASPQGLKSKMRLKKNAVKISTRGSRRMSWKIPRELHRRDNRLVLESLRIYRGKQVPRRDISREIPSSEGYSRAVSWEIPSSGVFPREAPLVYWVCFPRNPEGKQMGTRGTSRSPINPFRAPNPSPYEIQVILSPTTGFQLLKGV